MSTQPEHGATGIERTLARAQAFTDKLFAENARLRQALTQATLTGTPAPTPAAITARVAELTTELAKARDEIASLSQAGASATPDSDRIAQLARELGEVRTSLAETEEQNSNLANLYVASHQLHSTLDFKEVVGIVMEIVVNLIGAESFCLMMLDGKTDELCVIAAEGMERTPSVRIKLGDGIIGGVAKRAEPYYYEGDGVDRETHLLQPLAAIPLKIKDQVIGVISVYRLFPQKPGFAPLDYKLFDLLAGHAATAIFSAKLFSESKRKLTTIQSFLDLLTTS